MTEVIRQSFQNSGFNFVKDVLSDMLTYGRNNGFADAVRRNFYTAEFDGPTRFLNNIQYATVALVSRGSVGGVEAAAAMISGWMAQGGGGLDIVKVPNALNLNRRRSMNSEAEEQHLGLEGGARVELISRDTDRCQHIIFGMQNLEVVHTHRELQYETRC